MTYDYSILIPTWNNLELLKCCIASIRLHSKMRFQILVYVNEGNDGTEKWLQSENIKYIKSNSNDGICIAMNRLRQLAKADILCYLNDDMYVLPNWDRIVISEIRVLHDPFIISSTMIEPNDHGGQCSIIANYGSELTSFQEQELVADFENLKFVDWSGSSWPPLWLTTNLWDQIGGFSEEFSPGMYSDPDLAMKAWEEGVRYFRGINGSRVYHFGSKSTARLNPSENVGRKIFLEKWGITARYFYKYYLRMGQSFSGVLSEPKHPPLGKLINKWKKFRSNKR